MMLQNNLVFALPANLNEPAKSGTAKRHKKLEGEIPSSANPPPGCIFHTRCPMAEDRCRKEVPQWRELSEDHYAACHLV